jgi:integrase
MALYTKTGEFWGEFELKNERFRFPLGVKVCGQPPPNLKLLGDVVFERARTRALVAFEALKKEFTDPKKSADRLARIHQMVTGTPIVAIRPADLIDVWLTARRRKTKLAPRHIKNVRAIVSRFNAFLGRTYPRITDFLAVTPAIAAEFMEGEESRGVSNKTHDNILVEMRAVFRAAGMKAGSLNHPFAGIPKKEDRTIHRKPYSQAELEKILAAALDDPVVGPVVTAAACTGMRREDCVRLPWRSVNMETGEIQLRVRKTNEPIFVPILRPLRQALEKLPQRSEFCFPAAVEMFATNPDGLNWRLGKIVKAAGFCEPDIETSGPRLRKPSKVGFHKFKTTFVSLALNAGVPVAMLRKVVGNTVVEVVLENYYQPSRDAIKEALDTRLPAFYTGRVKHDLGSDLKAVLETLEGVTSENWEQRVDLAAKNLREAIRQLGLRKQN